MTDNRHKLQKLWKHALNDEVEAARLYFIAAGKTHNKEIKKLLNSLSKEEENHFFIILKIFNQVTEKLKSFTYSNEDREKAVKNITDKIRKAEINNRSKLEDIIKFAIREERKAQKFYSELNKKYNVCQNPAIKNIIKRLINEEKEHEYSISSLLKK